jgi:competence protein ComGC
MLSLKEKFLKFKSEFELEYMLNVFVVIIISVILFLACLSLYRPITTLQYQHVKLLAKQESYPKTQAMALELTHEETIRSADYYRLMYAKHYESSHRKTYPAATMDGK